MCTLHSLWRVHFCVCYSGDEGSPTYLEGFRIDFNATKPCCANDLTINTLLYDLANDVIIDKSGRGVSDIHGRALRIPLGVGETLSMWSATGITTGGEELRYLKFWLRAEAAGTPYSYDPAELEFDGLQLSWVKGHLPRSPNALRAEMMTLRRVWLATAIGHHRD